MRWGEGKVISVVRLEGAVGTAASEDEVKAKP